MKQLVISSVELNRNFAFVKGNRQINAKAVAAKVKSIREYGQLSPITVVKGEDVYLSGGHLVDLDGNDIPDEQTENYFAVLDGQHRLMACLKLGMNLDNLVIAEPLNVEMSIVALIAEMNICTTSWKGTDYMAGPAMTQKEPNAVFDFAMYLRSKDFPLATISLWCIGKNSLKPSKLVKYIGAGNLDETFDNTVWLSRSQKWYEAAEKKFDNTFLAKKYLINHIIDEYHNAEDPTAFTIQMVERINNLTEDQVKEIMNPKKVEDQTREQTTLNLLAKYLG
ncbi:MAG: ParB/Srx family N-terminal domain-containing protein [Alistipes sp.]|nr:ParB/Srx family N-terminal domain-containing protein [Alistipes sp.]